MSKAITKIQAAAIIVVVVVAAIAGVWWYYTQLPKPEVKPIVIGGLFDFTGPVAYSGWLMYKGALMAEKYINDRGGVLDRPIKIIAEDDMSKVEVAVAAAEKLVTADGAIALVGFYKSFISKAVTEAVTDKYKIVQFTCGWIDDLTAVHNKYVFRAGPFIGAQTEQWSAFIEYLAEKSGRTKVALYSENTDYGIEFQDAMVDLLEAGGKVEIVSDTHHDWAATDFTADLISIKGTGAQIFWTSTVSAAVMTMIKQAHDVGLSAQSIMTSVADGFYYTEEYAKTVGEAGDHLIVTNFHQKGLHYTSVTAEMDELYREMGYGDAVEFYICLQVFQDVITLCKGIEAAGTTDADPLIKALEGLEYEGAWGTLKFSMEPTGPYYHQWTPPMLFVQYQDLVLKVIYPEELAEVPTILP